MLILASRWDVTARPLSEAWQAWNAQVLTPEMIGAGRMRFRQNGTVHSRFHLGGMEVTDVAIAAVLTRLPCVSASEFPAIHPEERSYVAAETHAFLVAWLYSLRCPVVNRPRGVSLAGPSWRPQQWTSAAAAAGLKVQRNSRKTGATASHAPGPGSAVSETATVVTMVAGESPSPALPTLIDQARALSKIAGVELLSVCFSANEPGAEFCSANLWPDVREETLASCLLDRLVGRNAIAQEHSR